MKAKDDSGNIAVIGVAGVVVCCCAIGGIFAVVMMCVKRKPTAGGKPEAGG